MQIMRKGSSNESHNIGRLHNSTVRKPKMPMVRRKRNFQTTYKGGVPMQAPTTRPCLICGNNCPQKLTHIERVGIEQRIQCNDCKAIYFTRTPENMPKYNSEYNKHFFRAGDIRKAGIMASEIGNFCEKHVKDPRILEAGMGNGLTIVLLKEQGYNIEGIDLDPTWVVYIAYKYNLKLFWGKFEKFCPTESYNLIYSSHVIEHTEDPQRFFQKAHDILEKNGHLWIETPDTFYNRHKYSRWHHFETRHPHEHLCLVSYPSLSYLAEKTGFSIREYEMKPQYGSIKMILQKKPISQNGT